MYTFDTIFDARLIAMEREIGETDIRWPRSFRVCILNGLNENRKGKPHSIRTMITVNAARTNKAIPPPPSFEDYSIIPACETYLIRWFFPCPFPRAEYDNFRRTRFVEICVKRTHGLEWRCFYASLRSEIYHIIRFISLRECCSIKVILFYFV